jgi:hypothetical protein
MALVAVRRIANPEGNPVVSVHAAVMSPDRYSVAMEPASFPAGYDPIDVE